MRLSATARPGCLNRFRGTKSIQARTRLLVRELGERVGQAFQSRLIGAVCKHGESNYGAHLVIL